MSSRKVGRPQADFRRDDQRYAVALIEAQLVSAKFRQAQVNHWQAAQHASLWYHGFDVIEALTYSGPPPTVPVGARLRRSPVKSSLRSGYDELVVQDATYPKMTGSLFEHTADGLRHKHDAWSRRSDAYAWMRAMASAWDHALYDFKHKVPVLMNPERACLTAAGAAGESAFAQGYLVPYLRKMRRMQLIASQLPGVR